MAENTQGTEQAEALSVAAQYPTEGLPRAEAINYTRIDRIGSQVQISFGYVDLNILVGLVDRAKRGERVEQAPVKVEVWHRLVFSPEVFANLKSQVDQIAATFTTPEVVAHTSQG